MLIGKSEHHERLAMGIDKGKYSFPLIIVDRVGLKLVQNKFSSQRINDLFAPTLAIDFDQVPMNFIPLDSESSNAEIAALVIPKILQHMMELNNTVTAEVIAVELFGALWGSMRKSGKEGVNAKINHVLEQAATAEFSKLFHYRNGTINIRDNPFTHRSDKRSATFRKLAKLTTDLRVRLEQGRTFTPEPDLPFE